MPADPWTELARLGGCLAAIAAVAAPVGWLCRRRARTRPSPVRPRVPWTGFDVAIAGFVVGMALPTLATAAVSQTGLVVVESDADRPIVVNLWARSLVLPVQLAVLWAVARGARPAPGTWAWQIAVATAAWAVLAPAVLLLNAGVNQIALELGEKPDDHPLTRVAGPVVHRVLLTLQAVVAAPLVEELLFRGLLQGWLLNGSSRPAERRAWSVLCVAVAFPLVTAPTAIRPAVFAVLLAAGWGVIRRVVRNPRTVGAVYASAAVFATIHSSVWPSPIPLFVLGLGLGWLTVRANGVVAAVVVHALFNAVSVLFVLSGGAK